jgi:hypothetical protein
VRRRSVFLLLLCCTPFFCRAAGAQKKFELGGFFESSAQVYSDVPSGDDARAAGAGRFQLWSQASLAPRFSWRGRLDFRLDTHKDVDRGKWLDLDQRGLRQPAGALSEFYFDMKLGRIDLRAGKQEIRWGRADGFNPTDNLIPYDYLSTFDDSRLGVTALKADAYLGQARIEAAWIPFYSPTRLPLLGQRWFPALPASASIAPAPGLEPVAVQLSYKNGSVLLPARTMGNSQWGVRWNQVVPHGEFSLSYFDGIDDLPYFRPAAEYPARGMPPSLLVALNREYYRTHVIGGDFATELGPFGIRAEGAYFDQTDPANLDHLLYIVGLDRTWGDWFVIVQYAGQHVPAGLQESLVFPDLGLGSSLITRVERTLGPSRSFEVKGVFRLPDGDLLVQPVSSFALSNSWRLKLGATFFAGPRYGYLGQFRSNSNIHVQLRYSF